MKITIIYDNYAYDSRLATAWGFSALVEHQGHRVLFDTGGDGPTLLGNMGALGIDPLTIESIVISHSHADHTGGLDALLAAGAGPTVYLLSSFPTGLKARVSQSASVVEAMPGQAVAADIFTTGEVAYGDIPEQALVIETGSGLVIVTGCAHPGVARMVAQARELSPCIARAGDPVQLVIGGFHLRSESGHAIEGVIAELQQMGVRQVAPCHCTGDQAIALFRDAYGEHFFESGVGRSLEIPVAPSPHWQGKTPCEEHCGE